MDSILIPTKLFPPFFGTKLISRQRLNDLLDESLTCGKKLTLISAPAGYGKSTLAAEWIQSCGRYYAWFSIDENDNDPVRFMKYLSAAVNNALQEIGTGNSDPDSNTPENSIDSLMTSILNTIITVQKPLILVLDDYHIISSQLVHEFVQTLLNCQPPSLHLIIITREDPPFSISRLRVRNHLTEIRAKDLKFEVQEAGAFLSSRSGLELKPHVVNIFADKTEGWSAALQLASLLIKNCSMEQAEDIANVFGGSSKYIIDYLVDEVLGKLDDELREFLYISSLMDRFNESLCDFLTCKSNSKSIIKSLEAANLFLIPLDLEGVWYRYHHLFADSLKIFLGEDIKVSFYKRASLWFNNNHLLDEAINYALKARDYVYGLELVVKASDEIFKTGELVTLNKWLEAVPEEYFREDEDLAGLKACCYFLSGRVDLCEQYVGIFENSPKITESKISMGRLMCLKASIANMREDRGAVSIAEKAVELLSEDIPEIRIGTLNVLGEAQMKEGNFAKAAMTYKQAYETGRNQSKSFLTSVCLYSYANCLNILGKRTEALRICNDYLKDLSSRHLSYTPQTGIIQIAAGRLLFEAYELEEAEKLISQGIKICSGVSDQWVINGKIILSLIKLYSGDIECALSVVKELYSISQNFINTDISYSTSCLEAEINLRLDKLNEVGKWADEWELTAWGSSMLRMDYSYIVYTRFLIRKNRLDEALGLLDKLEKHALKIGCKNYLITINILVAFIYKLQNSRNKALEYVSKALSEASPELYFKPFIVEGQETLDITTSFQYIRPAFLNRLKELSRHNNLNTGLQDEMHDDKDKIKSFEDNGKMVEKLSEREIEILIQMASGLTNAQIAGKLYISTNTAQWHIANIYSKLGVKNRVQAIALARELKLI